MFQRIIFILLLVSSLAILIDEPVVFSRTYKHRIANLRSGVRARFVHSEFYIFYFLFKNRKTRVTPLFSFSFFKNLLMQNLNLCKTHRFIELLVKITYVYLYT